MQKAKKKYDNGGKEKAAKYYQTNKDVITEKANSKYNILTKEEKEARIGIKTKENAKENTNLFLQYKDE